MTGTPQFISPQERDTGYDMMPSDYNNFVNNLINLNARLAIMEVAGGGGLTAPTNVPVGGILMWMRSQGEIPAGWHLCDGTVGTVDLRGMFTYGALDDSEVGDTGGAETHSHGNPHTGSASGHSHSGSGSTGGPSDVIPAQSGGGQVTAASSSHSHSFSFNTGSAGEHSHSVGDTDLASNLPPYIKVFYIQRIA